MGIMKVVMIKDLFHIGLFLYIKICLENKLYLVLLIFLPALRRFWCSDCNFLLFSHRTLVC